MVSFNLQKMPPVIWAFYLRARNYIAICMELTPRIELLYPVMQHLGVPFVDKRKTPTV